MGLKDLFKKKSTLSWTIQTGSDEKMVSEENLMAEIRKALAEVADGSAEFLVVAPSEPLNGVSFLQTCQDKSAGFLHIEAGFTELNVNGRPKILNMDALTMEDTVDRFRFFVEEHRVSTEGWKELDW